MVSADISQNKEHKMNERELLNQSIKDHQSAINVQKARLEALDKPSGPRHGDYGYDHDGAACLRMLSCYKKQFVVANKDTTFGNDSGVVAVPKPVLGNIFDDLKRDSEDLEEFCTDVHRYFFNFVDFSHAPIHIAGNWHTINEAIKHHQKLGQLIATARRRGICK